MDVPIFHTICGVKLLEKLWEIEFAAESQSIQEKIDLQILANNSTDISFQFEVSNVNS